MTYSAILQQIQDQHGQLVAVSKTRSIDQIMTLYDQGQRVFGENRVQELTYKQSEMPKDIQWHLIGQLQKNKVKYIAPFVSMIHSIDSEALMKVVQKEAQKNNRPIPILLQIKIATEESKSGWDLAELTSFLEEIDHTEYSNIEFAGVMGMASFVQDQNQVKSEFQRLKNIFDQLKKKYFYNNPTFKEISMGMSGDYEIALAEGATMVRIGSLLF